MIPLTVRLARRAPCCAVFANTASQTFFNHHHPAAATHRMTPSRPYVSFGDEEEDVNDEVLKSLRKSVKYPPSKQIRGRYVSPWSAETNKKLWDVLRLLATPAPPPLNLAEGLDNKSIIPQLPVDMDAIRSTAAPHCTWMGHASCYYQTDGIYFLTDPVWSQRASPLSFAGPKRYTQPPVDVANIKIDVVLISHTHYDHLDVPTARIIGNRALWVVPMGVKRILNSIGITNVVELDWWGSYHYLTPKGVNIEIVFTPTKHWTSRTPFDRNTALWGSFAVLGGQSRFFFTGDSAYCSVFKTVSEYYGPFDFAAIPIGAYSPRWFMKDVHCNPEEAVRIHHELRAKRSCAIHWGTFPLTNEDPVEPAFELARIRNINKISSYDFFTMGIGETMGLRDEPKFDLATVHDEHFGSYLQTLRSASLDSSQK